MPGRRSVSPLIPHWTVLSNTAGSSIASTHSDDDDDGPAIIPNRKRKAHASVTSRSQQSKALKSREEARPQGRSRSRSSSLEDRIMPSIDRMESLSQPLQRKEQAKKRIRSGRRVSTQSFIKDAQKSAASGATTRVRKTVRKSTKSLPVRSKAKDVIEVTDSDDADHMRRAQRPSQVSDPSQPSEVIVLSSDSEEEDQPAPKRIQVQSGPSSASRLPASNAREVISLQTSDEKETLPPGDVDDLPMFQPQSRNPSPVPIIASGTTALPITPDDEQGSAVVDIPTHKTPLPPIPRPAVLRRSIFLPVADPAVPSPSTPNGSVVDAGVHSPSPFTSHPRETTSTNEYPAAAQPIVTATQPRLRINEIRVKGPLCNTSFFSRALGQLSPSTQSQRLSSSISAPSSSIPFRDLTSTPNNKAQSTPMIVPRPPFPLSSSSALLENFGTSRLAQTLNGMSPPVNLSPAKAPLSSIRRESGLANLSGEMKQLCVAPEKEVTAMSSHPLRSDAPSDKDIEIAIARTSEGNSITGPEMEDDTTSNLPDEDHISWGGPHSDIEMAQMDQVMQGPEMDDTTRDAEASDSGDLYAEPTFFSTRSPAQHANTATLPRPSMVHSEEFSVSTDAAPAQPLSSVSNSDGSSPTLTYPLFHTPAKSMPGVPVVPLVEGMGASTRPEVTEVAMPNERTHHITKPALAESPSLPKSPAPSVSSEVPARVVPPSRLGMMDYPSPQRPASSGSLSIGSSSLPATKAPEPSQSKVIPPPRVPRRYPSPQRPASSGSLSVGLSSLPATKAPEPSQSKIIPPPRVPRRSGPDLTLPELMNQVRAAHLQKAADRARRRNKPEVVDLTLDDDVHPTPPPPKLPIADDPGQAVFERLLAESRKHAVLSAPLEKSGGTSSQISLSQQSPRSTDHTPSISLIQPPRSTRKPAHSPSSSLAGPQATLGRERKEKSKRLSSSDLFSSYIRREPSGQGTSSTMSPTGNARGSDGSPVSLGYSPSSSRPAPGRSRLHDINSRSPSQAATSATPTSRTLHSPNIKRSSNKVNFESLMKLDLESVSKNKQSTLAKDTVSKVSTNTPTILGPALHSTNPHASDSPSLSTSSLNPISASLDHKRSHILVSMCNANTTTHVESSNESSGSQNSQPLSPRIHLPPAERQASNNPHTHSLSNLGILPSPPPSDSLAPDSVLAKTPMHPSRSPPSNMDLDTFQSSDVGEMRALSDHDAAQGLRQDTPRISVEEEEMPEAFLRKKVQDTPFETDATRSSHPDSPVSAELAASLEAFLGEEIVDAPDETDAVRSLHQDSPVSEELAASLEAFLGEEIADTPSDIVTTRGSCQVIARSPDEDEDVEMDDQMRILQEFIQPQHLMDSDVPEPEDDIIHTVTVKPRESLQLSTVESDHEMDSIDTTNDVDSRMLSTSPTTEGTIAIPAPNSAPVPVSSPSHPDSDVDHQNLRRVVLRRKIHLPVHETDFMTASHSLPTPALSASPFVIDSNPSDEDQEEGEAEQTARERDNRHAQSVVPQSGDSSEEEVAHLVEAEIPSVEQMSEHSEGYANGMASSSVVSSRAESSRRSLVSSRPSSVDPMDIIGDNDVEYMVNGKPLPTLAGHIIVRWENYVYFAKQRPLAYHLAKDLPHSLEDRMNSMSDDFRNSDNARIIFEEAIQQNTDDEPDAPRIQIYNEVDEEATPPWEFHYTNRMWYGKGIPPPDVKNLASCNCRGKCNPKSRSCVCLKRQRQWLDKYVEGGSLDKKDAMGFLYDEKGRLRMQDFPIFECNKFCGCDDECTNRVVQNGRKCTVNIVKTENKGWGVFAWTKKIPKGSYIGIYAGELLTEQEGEIRGKVYNKIGRTYLFDVDFSHLKGLFGTSDEEPEWENRYVVDAFHAGNFTRFLNHSCNPNCTIVACYINEANIDKPLLTVFTSRDVEPYEELCFSYAGIDDEDPSKAEVKRDAVYGRCYCGAIGCRGQMFA